MLNRPFRLSYPFRYLFRLLTALVACPVLLLVGCSTGSGSDSGPVPGTRSPASTVSSPPAPVSASASGLATVRAADLPPEARTTLRLIGRGGPYPYKKDGSTFGNFEGLLPDHKRGYYREYTVPTPGERDRGARRIVTGQEGEVYYTDDHYQTFRVVLR